jgi:hypothetical protein
MANRTINISVGPQDASGAYKVSAALVPDVLAAITASQTAAATAATDAAAALTYASSVGVTGTAAASVTLTAAQANSLEAKMALVQTDVAAVTTDIANSLLSVPVGGMQLAYDTSAITSWGQLRDGALGAVRFAQGAGLKT